MRHKPTRSHCTARVTKVTQRKEVSMDATSAGNSVAVLRADLEKDRTPQHSDSHRSGSVDAGRAFSMSGRAPAPAALAGGGPGRPRPQVTTQEQEGPAHELPQGFIGGRRNNWGRFHGDLEIPSSIIGKHECNLGLTARVTPFVPRH